MEEGSTSKRRKTIIMKKVKHNMKLEKERVCGVNKKEIRNEKRKRSG